MRQLAVPPERYIFLHSRLSALGRLAQEQRAEPRDALERGAVGCALLAGKRREQPTKRSAWKFHVNTNNMTMNKPPSECMSGREDVERNRDRFLVGNKASSRPSAQLRMN